MVLVGERLAVWLSGNTPRLPGFNPTASEREPAALPPEQPAHCQTCGGSLYLVDRDDNGMCDECWTEAEKVSFDEQVERHMRIAKGGF